MSRDDELRDGLDGSVLTAAEIDLTTSAQAGETWCWEPDEDVIDEFERYEWYEDLYPEVSIRRVRGADGEYLPIVLGGDFVDSTPDFEELEYNLRDEVSPQNIVPIDHTIRIYSFQAGFHTGNVISHAPGTLVSHVGSVAAADMWEHAEGGELPEWVFFIADYNANWVGSSATHSLAASVHPLEDVAFIGASPLTPPVNPYRWHHLLATNFSSFTFSGTGNHSVYRRRSASDYAPWAGSVIPASIGRQVATDYAFQRRLSAIGSILHGAPPVSRREIWRQALHLSFRTGGTGALNRLGIQFVARGAGRFVAPAAIASIGASYGLGAAGYDIARVRITPVDTDGLRYPPATITLVVD